jgi:hypothetical protein
MTQQTASRCSASVNGASELESMHQNEIRMGFDSHSIIRHIDSKLHHASLSKLVLVRLTSNGWTDGLR